MDKARFWVAFACGAATGGCLWWTFAGTAVGAKVAPSGPMVMLPAPEPAARALANDATADRPSPRVFSSLAPLSERAGAFPMGPIVAQMRAIGVGATPSAVDAASPGTEDRRRDLARNIQRELKRVGCYAGETDGQWSASTRRAMTTFTEHVNARLPTDVPDVILLTLVQGHSDRACGRGCPAGQAVGGDGHCAPAAMLTRAAKKVIAPTRSEPRIEPRVAVAIIPPELVSPSRASTAVPLPGRMAVGAPVSPDPARLAVRSSDRWKGAVATTPPVVVYAPPVPARAPLKAAEESVRDDVAPRTLPDPGTAGRRVGRVIARYAPPSADLAAPPAPVVRPARARTASASGSFRRPTGALLHSLTRNSP